MRTLRAFAAIALLSLPVHGEEIIRSSRELEAACRENRPNIPFEVCGVVIVSPNVPQGHFMLLSEDGLLTLVDMRPDPAAQTSGACRMGNRVIARGRTEPYAKKHETTANCHDIQVIESDALPDVTPLRIRDFLAGDSVGKPIAALHGILQDAFPDDIDVHHIFAILSDGNDSVHLICNCPRSWLSDFRALLGCDVVATGITVSHDKGNPRHLGPRLKIAGTNAFRIVSRSSGYPSSAPELANGNITDPSVLAKLGPQSVRGTVLATWGRESFLLRPTEGTPVCINLTDGPLPPLYASVEAVGVAETDLCHVTLSRASWQPADLVPTEEPSAEETTLERLFTSGRLRYSAVNVNAHGKTLTVRGTVKNIAHDANGSRKLLLADGEHTILVLCGPDAQGDPPPEEGWRIAVTGVCVKDSDVWRPTVTIPKIRGLFLVTRSDDDFVVLQKTPWWTPARLALAIAVLLALLVATVIWNATLRALVARRSREVVKAQTAKLESEMRIGERTRLAAELHDNTVQNLTAIAYRITAAQGALGDRETEAGRILQVAAKMLKSCRTSLRQCLWDLRNDALNEPDFETAIRRTVETVSGDARLSIRFSGRRDLINDTTAHAVLNILRELVSNATIHGKADAVSIAGEARLGTIRFSVSDNGTGFDPAHRPGQDEGHFGIDGIQERLESLSGRMDIRSSAGNGTYVRITIQRT